ncbi:MAG: alanine--glyoxylate aminotransferase family protein [Planctomycetota bacterium]
MKTPNLFIPGPTDVAPEILQTMTTPMIGHRVSDFAGLFQRFKTPLQRLFFTKNPVYVSTSSATGVMEGSLRNASKKRILSCVNGAFSERWFELAKANNRAADALSFEWGQAVKPDAVKKALETGKYDAVTVVHNETSTGVMSPLAEIGEVAKKFPAVFLLVDAVSSLAGAKIEADAWGIDVLLAGSQKCLALPPGICVFSVSPRVLERAKTIPDRGGYFDFIDFHKSWEKDQTPNTPVLPLLYALAAQMERFEKEGLENRFARHVQMAKICREWGLSRGFELFPEKGYESVSLTTLKNTRNIDLKVLNKALKEKRNAIISDGYGKLKGVTIRIAHMGEITPARLQALLGWIDEELTGT